MQIDLDLDDDAYAFASYYAGAKGIPLGAAISELLLRAEQAPETPSPRLITNPRGMLVVAKGNRTLTPEMITELSEDDLH